MPICRKCGSKINGTEKFCTECGLPVISENKKDFSKVKFKWTFRNYQQVVLDNAKKHLKDKRIHIVAAPGSGKTILGLELIRRLNAPALVISPSVTIRGQWGERFAESYLPKNENVDGYVSYNLAEPKLITSITYQALHAAFTKAKLSIEADEDALEQESALDFSNFELLEEIKKAGISTLCLDEAHHLKSEWQKALEKFIELLDDSVNVIALTATPPYDSTPAEWSRYIAVCGEIDEEIFVPQLVFQKTLCPHQDYVYFNYPEKEELELLTSYKETAKRCTAEIIKSGLPYEALKNCGVFKNDELLYDHIEGFASLACVVEHGGTPLSPSFKNKVYEGRSRNYTLSVADKAFDFVVSSPDIFGEASESLRKILSENRLIEKKKVCLESTDKLKRMLVSSAGKLKSISRIAEEEYKSLGNDLRMLILTDYIKKEMLSCVGTNEEIHTIGTVPIFESLRRSCPSDAKLALLSGTLVILPSSAASAAIELAQKEKISAEIKQISNTEYCEIRFGGSNKNKVSLITKLFGEGYINILIGTKSLLGEGWDSPNINSLILASFVGSFMLSNQMRGRAIRIDKKNPDKISNIWHLVTLDPTVDTESALTSEDFATLERRFACFQAPAYNSDVIESGVDRLDIIKPPFSSEGIEGINRKMLALANNRGIVSSRWQNTVKGNAHPEVVEVSEVPVTVQPAKAIYKNRLGAVLLSVGLAIALLMVLLGGFFGKLIGLAVSIPLAVLLIGRLIFISANSSPEKSISTLADAIMHTLKDIGEIESGNVRIYRADSNTVSCALEKASAREKMVFSNAITQMLSPIDDPRYIMVYKGKLGHDWSRSYACPAVIGKNKETAEILTRHLKRKSGNFELVFTRSEQGRKALFYARKHSYININSKLVKSKKTIK